MGRGSEDANCYWLYCNRLDLPHELVEVQGIETEYGLVCGIEQLFREALHGLGRQLACGDVAAISEPVPSCEEVSPLGRGAAQVYGGAD